MWLLQRARHDVGRGKLELGSVVSEIRVRLPNSEQDIERLTEAVRRLHIGQPEPLVFVQ